MIVHRSSGYTLLEVIVVLVLLTIAAAVVAPSLYPPRLNDPASLGSVIGRGREAAVRRGELVRLHIGGTGFWQLSAGSTPETLMAGRLQGTTEGSIDLVFSPLGSCGAAPEVPPQIAAEIDPLTCEMRSR